MSDIPVVILCGGQGTRMQGDTLTKKELVAIGDRPVLWHVMRIFSAFGHQRFVLALGYEGQQIRRFFLDYEAMVRDFTLTIGQPADPAPGEAQLRFHNGLDHPPWQVSLVDTGRHTPKASRIARLAPFLDGGRFFVTYGDGVGDIDLAALLAFHQEHGRLATITAVQVAFQYGVVEAETSGRVLDLKEKPALPYWINAGFMLFESPALTLMQGPAVDLETDVLPRLAAKGELMLFRHRGFWRSMDTLKDAQELDQQWRESTPWKVW